jgi:hypothetical protein
MNYRIKVYNVVEKDGYASLMEGEEYDVKSFAEEIKRTAEGNESSVGYQIVDYEFATLKGGGYRITFLGGFDDEYGYEIAYADFQLIVDNMEFKDLRKLFGL